MLQLIWSGKFLQPGLIFADQISGLYYKHITIINDDSSDISKWFESLIDDARVIIYDRNMFIVQ
jgi:hypothetical protein